MVMFSQDLNWLISARALSGVGGGGIVNSVWVITSELVEIPNRAKWSQALSVTWSCSAVAGPLLGGIFSSTPCSPYPAYISNLIESVSSKLFHFKLAMGMYVMISFWFGNLSFLTPASHSLSQPSHLLNWCSCTCAFTKWSRVRSEGRLLERFSSQVRFYRLVSSMDFPLVHIKSLMRTGSCSWAALLASS